MFGDPYSAQDSASKVTKELKEAAFYGQLQTFESSHTKVAIIFRQTTFATEFQGNAAQHKIFAYGWLY